MRSAFTGFLTGAAGYTYDFFRYLKYTSATGIKSKSQRTYSAIKIYHALEKSLAFRNRSKDSGWKSANSLVNLLSSTESRYPLSGLHENSSIRVLHEFISSADTGDGRAETARDFLKAHPIPSSGIPGGTKSATAQQLAEGTLKDPERFFHSRHSVRDFSEQSVDRRLIERAVSLATSTPSVCNRQAWHVYHLDQRAVIDAALSFQNGNRGFGETIQCLLIIAADLSAFDSGSERYQHWIDGGMFSMTLLLALHSLGLSTCCLNWSKGPRDDMKVRRSIEIRDEHSIVMYIAVGTPNPDIKLCCSPRTPVNEILTDVRSVKTSNTAHAR